MSQNNIQIEAIKLKGRLFTLTVLQLLNVDLELIESQIISLIAQAPKLFKDAPVVLDLQSVKDKSLDLFSVTDLLTKHHIIPVGVQGASDIHQTLAERLGLALFKSSKHEKAVEAEAQAQAQAESNQSNHVESNYTEPSKYVEENIATTKLITKPVRSGQQIYAQGGDLVVIAPVSRGSELLADGNIHVYGTLRGRALAGINGNSQARIFCNKLDAELISIAGYYLLNDGLDDHQDSLAKQIYLQDEKLFIESL